MGLYKRDRVWWMRFNHSGRQLRRSCETTSKKLAEKIFCKVMSNVTEGKFFEVDPRETTFEELCQDLETDYKINKRRTADRLSRTLRHLKGTFEGMKAVDITTGFIQNYILKRQDVGAANATINREMAALKRMFNLGVRTTPQKVTSVPYIHHLQENNVRQGYFEHDEFIALRDALPSRLKPMVTMAYYTGMRKMEILGLKWSQVNLKEGKITLSAQETKNKESRVIFMEGELLEAVRSQLLLRNRKHPQCPFVFFGATGRPLSNFGRAWRKACKAVGLTGRIPHDFRRTAVRNMVRAGVPERVAMMVSGHKTRSVFDRYNIVNEDDLRLAAKKVQERFSTIIAQSENSGFETDQSTVGV